MGKTEIALLILGLLSLVALAAPGLGVIPAITIIGLPIAAAYWATPALFMLALIAYLVNRVLKLPGKIGIAVSLMAAACLLAVPPYLLNGSIEKKAVRYTTGDLNRVNPPLKARTWAIRQKFRFSRGATPCDGFCLHALLSGTAKRVLVADTKQPHGEILPDEEVQAFRLERRAVCPEVSFKSGQHALKFARSKGDRSRVGDPVETLKLRASGGECLIQEAAKLAEADIVVSRGKASEGVYRYQVPTFNLLQDMVIAERITVHRKSGTGEFDEMFRRTEVRYRPLGWLLVPSISMRGNFETTMGWWRRERTINIKSRYHNPHDWSAFLTGTLGLQLQLKGEDAKKKTLDKLMKLLDEETPPSAADVALFAQYFGRFGLGANTRVDARDYRLAARMLANMAYPAPPRLQPLVRFADRAGEDADLVRLAGLLITRLADAAEGAQPPGSEPEEQIRHLAFAIRALPDRALLPHRNAMLALAPETDIQRHGYVALKRLAVFGDTAVPQLLNLIRTGLEGGEYFFRDNRFQHPFIAGLGGLCTAGQRAPSALEELRRLTASGRMPDHGSYGRLLFTTLLRLGEDPEVVRGLFVAAATNKAYASDKHFKRFLARAQRKRPHCSI